MLRSRNRASERMVQIFAWHAAVTINHNGMMKHPVSPDDLLGRSRKIDLLESPEALAELTAAEAEDDGI